MQKKVESLHYLLKQTEVKDNNKSLKNEVRELEKEIDKIEDEWNRTKGEMENSIEDFRT